MKTIQRTPAQSRRSELATWINFQFDAAANGHRQFIREQNKERQKCGLRLLKVDEEKIAKARLENVGRKLSIAGARGWLNPAVSLPENWMEII